MAFFIDILTRLSNDRSRPEICEFEYSMADRLARGWLSADGVWLREQVCAPSDEGVFPGLPRPDPMFGKQLVRLVREGGP